MTNIDRPALREIINDFAQAIEDNKRKGSKPEYAVIDFRDEKKNNYECEVWLVPVELLRYRKDNGRIRADVISYERSEGKLLETKKETQDILRRMLEENDPEKNEELYRSVLHAEQKEPAIITCDGFLINGNRRKMTLERINDNFPGKYKYMKVVILPGKDDKKRGGPPTILEIEEIENRYQHQSEGKAEYSSFNTALSIKRKMQVGMPLEQILLDDPYYAVLPKKQFDKEMKVYYDKYLGPLNCIDRYLKHLDRDELYKTVVASVGDKEGRWQAFLDYHNHVYKKFQDEKQRIRLGIEEDEVGLFEDVAFKIIRKREFKGLPKLHQIMREFPKWLTNPDAKQELLVLADVDLNLPHEETLKADGSEIDEIDKDRIWSNKHATVLHRHLKNAKDYYDQEKSHETPIELLEAALKKLTHENLQLDSIKGSDIAKAKKIVSEISKVLKDIEDELYDLSKKVR